MAEDTDVWRNSRRLPYFFSYSGPTSFSPRQAVLCPQCALEHVQDERLRPRFHINRSITCSRCWIVLGPISEEELIEIE